MLFVAFRVLHGLIYVAGWKHSLRSLAWLAAFICVVVLFVDAALYRSPEQTFFWKRA